MNSRVAARQFFSPHKGIVPKEVLDKAMGRILDDLLGLKEEKQQSIFPNSVLTGLRQSALATKGIERKDWWAVRNGTIAVYEDLCTFEVLLASIMPKAIKGQSILETDLQGDFKKSYSILLKNLLSKKNNPATYVRVKALGDRINRVLGRLENTAKSAYVSCKADFDSFRTTPVTSLDPLRSYFNGELGLSLSDQQIKKGIGSDGTLTEEFLFDAFSEACKNFAKSKRFGTLKKQLKAFLDPTNGLFVEYITLILDSIETFKRKELVYSSRTRATMIKQISDLSQSVYDINVANRTFNGMTSEERIAYCATMSLSDLLDKGLVSLYPGVSTEDALAVRRDEISASLKSTKKSTKIFGVVQRKKRGAFFSYGVWRKARAKELDLKGSSDSIKTAILENDYITEVAEEYVQRYMEERGYEKVGKDQVVFLPDNGGSRKVFEYRKKGEPNRLITINKEDMANIKIPLEFDSMDHVRRHYKQVNLPNQLLLKNPYVLQDLQNRNLPKITEAMESQLFGDVVYKSLSDDASSNSITRVYPTRKIEIDGFEYNVVTDGRFKGHILEFLVNAAGKQIEGSRLEYSSAFSAALGDNFSLFTSGQRKGKRSQSSRKINFVGEINGRKVTVSGLAPTLDLEPFMSTYEGGEGDTKLFLTLPTASRPDGLKSPYIDFAMREKVANFVDQFCPESVNISADVEDKKDKDGNLVIAQHATYLVDPSDYAKIRDFLGSCAMTTDASRTVEGYYQNLRRFVAATSEDNLSFYSADALKDIGDNPYFKPGVKLNNMQRKAIAWMEENGFRGVMGLGTGVGKTLLSAVSAYMILEQKFQEGGDTSNGRVLYVQPKALVGNLTGELQALTNIPNAIGNIGKDVLSLQIADGSSQSLEALRSDSPRRAFDEVAYETFDAMPQDDIDRYSAILFDEAQNLNPVNPLSTSRARKAARAQTENKILLTASTMEESPQDLFKLVAITNGQDLFPDAKLKASQKNGILYEDLHDFPTDSASDKKRKAEIKRILIENNEKWKESGKIEGITYSGKVTYATTSAGRGHLGAVRDLLQANLVSPAFKREITSNNRQSVGRIRDAIKARGARNISAVAQAVGVSQQQYEHYLKKNSALVATYDGKRLLNPIISRNLKVAENFQDNYATRIGSRWVGLNPDPIKKNEFLTWVSTNAFFANKLDVDFEEINKPALASIDQETVTLSMPPELEECYKKIAKEVATSLNNLALYFKDGRVDQEGLKKLKPSERNELFSQVNKVSRQMRVLNMLNLRPREAIELAMKPSRGQKALLSKDEGQKLMAHFTRLTGGGMDVGYKSIEGARLATERMREGAGLSRTIFFADDPATVERHAQFMSKQKGMTDSYHVSGTAKSIKVFCKGQLKKSFEIPKTPTAAKKIESEINDFKVKSLGFSPNNGGAPRPPKPSQFKTYRAKAKNASPSGAMTLVSNVLENAKKVQQAWAKVSAVGSAHYESAQALDAQVVAGLTSLNRSDNYATVSESALRDAKFREEIVIDALSMRDKNLYNRSVIEKILNPPIPQTSLEDREDDYLITQARALDLNKVLDKYLDPENPKALISGKVARKNVIKAIKDEQKKRKGINPGNWQKKVIESLFVKDPACGVVTVTLTGKEGRKGSSAGFSKGFNLQTFDTVIHLDRNSWSSEEMEQRRGRAWRTGQPDRVQEYTVDLVFANEKDYVDASEQNKQVDKLSDEELLSLANKLIEKAGGTLEEISNAMPNIGEMPKAVREADGSSEDKKTAYAVRMGLEVAIKGHLAEKMDEALDSNAGGLLSSVDTIRKYLEQSDSDLFAQVIQGSTQLTEADDDGEAPLGKEYFSSEEKVGGKALSLQNQAFIGSLAPISSGLKDNDDRQKKINAEPIRSLRISEDLGRFNEATVSVGGSKKSATDLMNAEAEINVDISAQLDGLPSVPTAADLIDMSGFSGLNGLKGGMDVNVNLQVGVDSVNAVRQNVKLPEGATLIEDGMVSVNVKGFNSPFGSMERVFYRYQDAEGKVKLGMYNASLRFQDNDCIPDGALDRLLISQINVAEKFGITKIDCDPKTEAKAALCSYGFSSQLSKNTISGWKDSFRFAQQYRKTAPIKQDFERLESKKLKPGKKLDEKALTSIIKNYGGYIDAKGNLISVQMDGKKTSKKDEREIRKGSAKNLGKATVEKYSQLLDDAQFKIDTRQFDFGLIAKDPDILRKVYEGIMYAVLSGRHSKYSERAFGDFKKSAYKKGTEVRSGMMFALKSEIDASLNAKVIPSTVREMVDFFLDRLSDAEGSKYVYDPTEFTDEQVVEEYNNEFIDKAKSLGVTLKSVPKLKLAKGELAWTKTSNAEKMYASMNTNEEDPIAGLATFVSKGGEAKNDVLQVLSPEDISYQKVREVIARHSEYATKGFKAIMRGKDNFFDAYVDLIRTPIKDESGAMVKHDISLDDLSFDLTDSEDNLSRKTVEAKMVKSLSEYRGDPSRWLKADLADFAENKDCEDKARAGMFPWVKNASLSIDQYVEELTEETPEPSEALLNINDFVSKLSNEGDCFTISDAEENKNNQIFNDLAKQKYNSEILDGVIDLVTYKSFK